MPIQVQDYEWSQTPTNILIKVPLKGVPGHKADIFSTNEYIKASYPPYIFEVFLPLPVDDAKSKATIGGGQITFTLEKGEGDITWQNIQHENHKDKEFARQKREEAVLYSQERASKQRERRAAERDQQQKYAVRQQMRVEEEEKAKIKAVKDAEIKKTMNEMEEWKQEQINQNIENGNRLKDHKVNENSSKDSMAKASSKSSSGGTTPKEEKVIPPPRSAGTIQLKFTPRAFVTPSRESKAPEEEAWLEKVAEMKKVKADAETRKDIEDMNPAWLKDKGNNFYKQGNFIAAINAFTAAIVLNGTDPSLYNNRAACHLHMKQYSECAQDSTMALNLLEPPVAANAKSRCIALVRRGTAHFKTENFVSALSDYEAALKIDPNNENVKSDAEKIRKIIQGS